MYLYVYIYTYRNMSMYIYIYICMYVPSRDGDVGWSFPHGVMSAWGVPALEEHVWQSPARAFRGSMHMMAGRTVEAELRSSWK